MSASAPSTPVSREPPDDFNPEAPAVLEELAACVGRFVSAWERAEAEGPPPLDPFLPNCPHTGRLVLVELVKVDLECRWGVFELPKKLHEYLDEFPVLVQMGPPAEVIYEEFRQRELAGDEVLFEDYLDAFPTQAQRLRQLDEFSRAPVTETSNQDSGESLEDFLAGDVIGDYQLLMPLGKGAFARVFLARQKSIQRLVALKISLDHGTEGQTLAQFDHDYIVRVFHQETMPGRSIRLLCMQYLPGGTLLSVVKRIKSIPARERSGRLLLDVIDRALDDRGENTHSDSSLRRELSRLSWPELVAWIGARLAEGLHYAHSKGVLHRDIKPANVLLTAEGVPKLADFNISFSSETSGDTPAAYFGGSLAYMSPEHLEAFHPELPRKPEELDARADFYSLAVLLWELLTGQRPFVDDPQKQKSLAGIEEMLRRRQAGVSQVALAEFPADAPASLRRVLLKALMPERDQRWPHAEAFSQQLQACLEPHARDLIDPPHPAWANLLLRRATLIVLALNLLPNAVAAVCNFLFNNFFLRKQLTEQAYQTFLFTCGIVNGVAFPLGIGAVVWLAWRVRQSIVHADKQRDAHDADDCLLLGDRCAKICFALWFVAGFAYPILLNMVRDDIPRAYNALFILSLAISGLIATAYPYFGVTWFAVHWLYPGLLRNGLGTAADRRSLHVLLGKTKFYLGMAASIPLLAILLLSSDLRWLVQVICIGGFAAVWGALKFQEWIEQDIQALSRLVVRDQEN